MKTDKNKHDISHVNKARYVHVLQKLCQNDEIKKKNHVQLYENIATHDIITLHCSACFYVVINFANQQWPNL